ncbi:hypothetical protein ACQ4LK_04520, partial [Bacillus pumilus]
EGLVGSEMCIRDSYMSAWIEIPNVGGHSSPLFRRTLYECVNLNNDCVTMLRCFYVSHFT